MTIEISRSSSHQLAPDIPPNCWPSATSAGGRGWGGQFAAGPVVAPEAASAAITLAMSLCGCFGGW